MRMSTMETPEIIEQDIKNTQQSNKKHSGIFCFESNGNHNTSKKSNWTKCHTTESPRISFEYEAEEKEDEKNSSS